MENYLYAHQPTAKEEKKNPAKYILFFIAFLLFGYGVYIFNAWYIRNSLDFSNIPKKIRNGVKKNWIELVK
jgi:hypothetical protein